MTRQPRLVTVNGAVRCSARLAGRCTSRPPSNPAETAGFGGDPKFRLAVPRPGTDGADFVDIALRPEVSAGTPESGRFRLNEWTGRDGEKRSKLQVVADAVQFLDPSKKAGDPDAAHAGEGRSLLRGQDRS